ncbi:MAG: glycoside hydrolase family 26 protein [Micromonosporaceae bacterium]
MKPRRRRRHAAIAASFLSLTVLIILVGSSGIRDRLIPMVSWGDEPSASADSERTQPKDEVLPAGCGVSAKLVPECGAWWGVAPGVFTGATATRALADFEAKTRQRADVLHRYHRGNQLFPTKEELELARYPGGERVLFFNWKVAWGSTWAQVAAGKLDRRIDRLAAHLKRTMSERFFLAIHHEPENDVQPGRNSGMTAADYAAMYRHTVQRLRAQGVDNAVFVMVYIGYQGWGTKSWFNQLYPGDSVVDWIGFDPYVSANPRAHHYGDFSRLVNMTSSPQRWPGFYNWAAKNHPGKPLMLSEWGVFEHRPDLDRKASIFESARRQLVDYPRLKALIYFDSPRAPKGDTRVDSSLEALNTFRGLATMPHFSCLRLPG